MFHTAVLDPHIDNVRKREELSKKPEYIKEVLDYGAQRARKEAEKTMAEVKTAMNVL